CSSVVALRRPPSSTLFPTRRSSDLGVGLMVDAEPRKDEDGDQADDSEGQEGRGQQSGQGDPAKYRDLPGPRNRQPDRRLHLSGVDRKSTRLNSSHVKISYAVFCLKK